MQDFMSRLVGPPQATPMATHTHADRRPSLRAPYRAAVVRAVARRAPPASVLVWAIRLQKCWHCERLRCRSLGRRSDPLAYKTVLVGDPLDHRSRPLINYKAFGSDTKIDFDAILPGERRHTNIVANRRTCCTDKAQGSHLDEYREPWWASARVLRISRGGAKEDTAQCWPSAAHVNHVSNFIFWCRVRPRGVYFLYFARLVCVCTFGVFWSLQGKPEARA